MPVKWIDSSAFSNASWEQLFEAETHLKKTKLFSGSTKNLSLNALTPDARAPKEGTIDFPDIYLYKITDVVLRGADVIYKDGVPYFFEQIHPRYTESLWPQITPRMRGNMDAEAQEIAFPTMLITHYSSGTYGHFLLEMLPKIIAFNAAKLMYPDLKIVISDFPSPRILDILRLFIRKDDMFVYDHKTDAIRVKELFLTDTLFDNTVVHPQMDAFIRLAQHATNQLNIVKAFPKIYLSKKDWRKNNRDYRALENEEEIQALMVRHGFEIISPDTLPWLEQVALMSSARYVVGEFCSALHNTLFSPFGSKVLGLNRVNSTQDCLGAFLGHSVGYVMPKQTIALNTTSSAAVSAEAYHITISDLEAALDSL